MITIVVIRIIVRRSQHFGSAFACLFAGGQLHARKHVCVTFCSIAGSVKELTSGSGALLLVNVQHTTMVKSCHIRVCLLNTIVFG